MNPSTTSKKKGIDQKINWVKWLNVAVIAAVVLYFIADFYNQFLTFQYTFLMGLIVFIYATIALVVSKKWVKALILIMIFAMAFVQFYPQNVINRLVDKENTQVNNVSVIVLVDSTAKSIEDLKDKKIAKSNFLAPDLLESLVQKHPQIIVKEKLVSMVDDGALVDALYKKQVEAIIINEVNRAFILEKYADFDQKTRVVTKSEVTKSVQTVKEPINYDQNGYTVLISGIDTYGPINTVSRSDVNILLTFNVKTHEIFTVAIPRDTFVYIPCNINGYDKLTHSGIDGIECTMETLSEVFDTKIDFYAKVNFTGFMDILNIVGPIEVNSHYAFEGFLGTYFEQGLITLDTEQALEFARTRKTVEGGDFTRGVHQQEVIKAALYKLLRSMSLTNIEPIVKTIQSSMDTNFDAKLLNQLIGQQLDINPNWTFEMMSISGEGALRTTTLYPTQELWVSYPDEEMIQQASNRINSMR